MVTRTVISVEAVFLDGVLRPTEELPLRANDRVLLRIELQPETRTWPDDTAEIYAETEAEDRAMAAKTTKASSNW